MQGRKGFPASVQRFCRAGLGAPKATVCMRCALLSVLRMVGAVACSSFAADMQGAK